MKHTITTKIEHPKRCIDPVMKYCQGCKYGHIIWPEWVETYEDTFGCSFDVKCIYGLEKTKPTKREIREFEEEKSIIVYMHESRQKVCIWSIALLTMTRFHYD